MGVSVSAQGIRWYRRSCDHAKARVSLTAAPRVRVGVRSRVTQRFNRSQTGLKVCNRPGKFPGI